MARSPISSDPCETELAANAAEPCACASDGRTPASSIADGYVDQLRQCIRALLEQSDAEIEAAQREADELFAAAEEDEADAAIEPVRRRI